MYLAQTRYSQLQLVSFLLIQHFFFVHCKWLKQSLEHYEAKYKRNWCIEIGQSGVFEPIFFPVLVQWYTSTEDKMILATIALEAP